MRRYTRHTRTTNLDMYTLVVGHIRSKTSTLVHWTRYNLALGHDTALDTHTVIILTKTGCLMNDTCTTVIGDVAIAHNTECLVLALGERDSC